jgi:hypothetical protein
VWVREGPEGGGCGARAGMGETGLGYLGCGGRPVWEGKGAFGGGCAVVDYGSGGGLGGGMGVGLGLVGGELEGLELGLLGTDHLEEAVLDPEHSWLVH